MDKALTEVMTGIPEDRPPCAPLAEVAVSKEISLRLERCPAKRLWILREEIALARSLPVSFV
jgi:hypothetical protein